MSDADPEDEEDGQQATRKQAKSAEKSDIGEANQPLATASAHPTAHSTGSVKVTATQTGEAAALAAAASRGYSKASDDRRTSRRRRRSGFTT